jgi:peroxiredoxin Q/BCP
MVRKMKKLTIGDKIPTFKLPDQNGKEFDIRSVLGKKNLVIFFYPKDDTPGCTREACYFRDMYEDFLDANAEVIGISGQSVESHRNFANKYKLNYTILSDKNNQLRKKFGVPANMFGLIPGRVTYVANSNGEVIYIFNSQTDVTGHVDQALKILSNN